jgi:mannose-6-phosphate isomerase-like protein (cupin superfamily)
MPETTAGASTAPRFRVTPGASIDEYHHPNNMHVRQVFAERDAIFESTLTFVLQNRLPPGETNTMHVHEEVEKVYYFLGGSGTATCGPTHTPVAAGDFLFFPANIPHQIESHGPDDLRFVVCGAKVTGTPKGMAE